MSATSTMKHLHLDPKADEPPTRDHKLRPTSLPAKETGFYPAEPGGENTSLFFVGTATTVLY
ncbi:hypothetical protein K432DRAFT_384855 [Lepidopterella palustris CBS 459.81]|uniref:Uncharacterized protein n=1 Tax=Lepidopterella palustris CBS 459.81 TaxID=1314670 RepID=A0A8E2E4I2_9PEZI|nr:hypothetical protein K432DRAFT_384855 [Lepidopterella palustris CBS 459.81]